jgi:hypothetical protein
MYVVSLYFLCALHTLHSLAGYFLLVFQFVFAKIPWESAWDVLFRLPWCVLLLCPFKFIRTELTWVLDFWYIGSCCLMQEFLALYVLFVCSISANLTLLWKWLDTCDDSGLSFCLKVIILFSNFCPSAAYIFILQIWPDAASHTILTSIPYFVIFAGLYVQISGDPAMGSWLCQVTVLLVVNWLEFLLKIA